MKKILVVSHDTGGAEVLSSWVKHHPEYSYTFVLAGPALSIYKKKIPSINIHSEDDLASLVLMHDTVLTSTSWQSQLERKAIAYGRLHKIHTITLLDHWCDYRERFILNNETILPNELWLTDEYALKIAAELFENVKTTLVNNYFYDEIKQMLAVPRSSTLNQDLRLLYICEPIAEYAEKQFGSSMHFNYTEFEALHYFIEEINCASYKNKIDTIKIRPHPSEDPNKYDDFLAKIAAYSVQVSHSSLIDDITWADWIIGCSSMALVYGLLANKRVYTCIPSGAKVFKLPHREILTLPKRI